ncbi:FliH/SctL family protein [Salinibacter ruber]|uniref:FliH/SctL family protein n=1 Tax=Salinibacter ruber TaxID=146919 RepID=UPI0021678A25|nr:FliH/SctL family protein [Salinibacter ruber]MCS3704059.1 flagellar assembly protein FliH [Salinibacter ruber]
MGRVIKNADTSEVTSVSLDEDVLAEGADRIPAEQVEETEGDDADPPPEDAAPQGRVLRAGEAGRSPEPVTVHPDEIATQDASGSDPAAPSGPDDTGTDAPSADGAADDPDENVPTRTDAEWRAHLEEKVEAARAEGYEEGHDDGYESGYDDGYAEAEATLRAEFDDTRRQLSEDIARFEELWETYIDDAESEIIELTLDLAETIVDAPFTETMRQASEEAVIEAVTELAATPPVTIRLHPVDCQRVRESGLVTRLQENYEGLTLEPEPDFEEGDWSVSSPTGVVRRLRAEVLETLRGELRRATTDSDAAPDTAPDTAPA